MTELAKEFPAAARVNAELVRMLESALGDAKAGRIVAGGFIAVIDAVQFMALSVDGGLPGQILAGCASMTFDVNVKLRQPRQSPIVRPAVNGIRQ